MESTQSTPQQWNIPEGTEIRSADDAKLGKVVAIGADYIVVEKGMLFPTDYYIPAGAVTNYDGEKAYLSLAKDEVLHQGWDRRPAGYTTETAAYADATTREPTVGTQSVRQSDDRIVVPVHEEELTATRRPVEYGEVRVDKDVIEEQRSIDVPVTEERVRVTRRVVDRAGAESGAFEEGSVAVPVRGEEVDVQKQVRVAEEVELAKEAVQRTERVTDSVRREQVNVDDAGLDTSERARTKH